MLSHRLRHLSDTVLLRGLHQLVGRDRQITAAILAHLAEVDERRLYVPAGYASMHAYCVGELRFSEHGAFRRIRAARLARQFPEILEALASGSVHLTAVLMLAPHLTEANARELLAGASGLHKHELEGYLVQRFGRAERPAALLTQLAPARVACFETGANGSMELDSGELGSAEPGSGELGSGELGSAELGSGEPSPDLPGTGLGGSPEAEQLAPARVGIPAAGPRHRLQLTIGEATRRKLRYAQDLLSHQVPSGDLAQVFDRALDALIAQCEERKFGATKKRHSMKTKPRPAAPKPRPAAPKPRPAAPKPRPATANTPRPKSKRRPRVATRAARARYIPAPVRRAVWERDRGRCTFVGETGHRCGTRRFLEFDHVDPVARGGRATVGGVRLRCRAHNQYEAERIFGGAFMSAKRRAARSGRGRVGTGSTRSQAVRVEPADPGRPTDSGRSTDSSPPANPHAIEVMAALRQLGCRVAEARRAAAHAMTVPGATLEESVRTALRFMGSGPRGARARSSITR